MAVRRATRTYNDLFEFLKDHKSSLSKNMILLPPGTVDGDLANEIKLDLVIPGAGRVGPIIAHVVQRMPGGAAALQFADVPKDAQETYDKAYAQLDAYRDWFVSSGEFASAQDLKEVTSQLETAQGDLEAAREQIESLEAKITAMAEGGAVALVAGADAGSTESGARARGFLVPDLSSVEPTASGEIGNDEFLRMLCRISLQRTIGLLTVTYPDGRIRYGFWDKPGMVGWRTEPLQEDEVLGILLFRAGQLTKDQLQQSLEVMEEQNCRQGEALIEMGLVTFPQLLMVLGKQTEYILQQVLRDAEGSWTYHELPALPEKFSAPPVKVANLVFRTLSMDARRPETIPEVVKAQKEVLNLYVFINKETINLLKELNLKKDERKFLGVIQGRSYRMRELFSVSPMNRSQTSAMLWALQGLGTLTFEESEDRARYIHRLSERVALKKVQVEQASLFDLLEVHWICLTKEVEAAHQRLGKEFDPGRFDNLPEELAADIANVHARIEAAYRLLVHQAKRREYRLELVEEAKIQQSADLLSKKGEMAIMKADRLEGALCYAKALELCPGSSAFKDGLARANAIV